ncbi:hypothetical protein PYCCODRAFT_676381 [Trametes coccinea BRFM310]|uniref:DUF6697 domain-containing protein n=1 Tax=Trametes coccinea (strain BRFM310) TaxID=1353009 RepID=A0A1Y2IHK1_TRAC3|nr:hypothetical protein PYCCODRAFT_676381 [Trametes coccinea BRFM310]
MFTRIELKNSPWRVPLKKNLWQSPTGRNFVFLGQDFQPYLPSQPGQPGLLLAVGETPPVENPTVLQSVFAGVRPETGSESGIMPGRKFVYLGDYQMTPASPLSVAEYHTLTSTVREHYVWRVIISKDHVGIRERVAPHLCKPRSCKSRFKGADKPAAARAVRKAYERGSYSTCGT